MNWLDAPSVRMYVISFCAITAVMLWTFPTPMTIVHCVVGYLIGLTIAYAIKMFFNC